MQFLFLFLVPSLYGSLHEEMKSSSLQTKTLLGNWDLSIQGNFGKEWSQGTSLVVQLLRLFMCNAGGMGSVTQLGELRSHMPHGADKK